MTRVAYDQGTLWPGFILARVRFDQGTIWPGFVLTRVCFARVRFARVRFGQGSFCMCMRKEQVIASREGGALAKANISDTME